MAISVGYGARALADLERIVDFLVRDDPAGASAVVELITDAVGALERHPFIGRVVRGDIRELVVSRGRTGHVALYRVGLEHDRVDVLAIRHQREAGFA